MSSLGRILSRHSGLRASILNSPHLVVKNPNGIYNGNPFTTRSVSSRRLFSSSDDSSGSHSDFAAVKKEVEVDEVSKVHKLIQSHVDSNRIMLYMKGSPSAPQCGFSARVITVLKSHDVPFSSVNVLEYDEIREGIKTFSDWPTIPQLYVDGEFVGGCDIIEQMEQEGELKELLAE